MFQCLDFKAEIFPGFLDDHHKKRHFDAKSLPGVSGTCDVVGTVEAQGDDGTAVSKVTTVMEWCSASKDLN